MIDDYVHTQVFVVVGGRPKTPPLKCLNEDCSKYEPRPQSTASTEVLVYGEASWSKAEPLPCAVMGLKVVSIDNKVISTGEILRGEDKV